MVIEEKLRHKQIHLQQVIDEYRVNKKRYEEKKLENKDEEINNFGISKTSELSISILEAINLQSTSFSGAISPYALIMFDQKEKTTLVKEETNNPVWNEMFDL